MALLFADGFDIYGDVNDLFEAGWQRQSTSVGFSTSLGRYGGGCLTGDIDDSAWVVGIPIAPGSTLIVCFAYWHNGNGDASDTLLRGIDYEGNQLFAVRHTTTGSVEAFGVSASAGSSVESPLTPNEWNWVEVKVVFGTNDTNGEIHVRINNSLVITATGIDTWRTNNFAMDSLAFEGSDGNWRADDVIVMDGTGATFNNFLGDSRIDTRPATGDGDSADWTSTAGTTYEAVATADEDTSYLESNTPDDRALVTYDPIEPSAAVFGVQVRARCRRTDAAPRTMRAVAKLGSDVDVGAIFHPSIEYVWERLALFDRNPADNTWTHGTVNAAQVGVEIAD